MGRKWPLEPKVIEISPPYEDPFWIKVLRLRAPLHERKDNIDIFKLRDESSDGTARSVPDSPEE
jgi:hypothetical protein